MVVEESMRQWEMKMDFCNERLCVGRCSEDKWIGGKSEEVFFKAPGSLLPTRHEEISGQLLSFDTSDWPRG